MKKLLRNTFFGLSLLSLGLGAYYQPATQNVPVNNNVKSIEVISLLESEQGFELALRNISNRHINGYCISFPNNASRTVDLTVGERTIGPGQQFKVLLPQSKEVLPPSIRYVVFEDGTGDGDPVGIGELQDRRSGRLQQLTRIFALLNRPTSDLEKLRMELRTLPEERDAERSIYFVQGQRNAKEDALLALDKMDKGNIAGGLTKLTEQTAKTLERLRPRTK
jgi:hypothetical protein